MKNFENTKNKIKILYYAQVIFDKFYFENKFFWDSLFFRIKLRYFLVVIYF